MKKVLTTLAIAGLTCAAFAQGTVSWTGSSLNLIVDTNGTTYSSFSAVNPGGQTGVGSIGATLGNTPANNAALGFSGYYYELLVSTTASSAPTTVAGLGSWLDANLQATNSASNNGRINQTSSGGAGGVAGNTQATASNWPSGTTESVILVGWNANLGTTWSAALNNLQSQASLNPGPLGGYYFGVSSMGSLASASGNPGVTVFGVGGGTIGNPSASPMVLEPLSTVPEPGTLALAALGGASLLMFRRKK